MLTKNSLEPIDSWKYGFNFTERFENSLEDLIILPGKLLLRSAREILNVRLVDKPGE